MCDDCQHDSERIHRCYCTDFNSSEFLKRNREMLEKYYNAAEANSEARLTEIQAKSRLEYDPEIAFKERRPNHIDFVPSNDTERTQYTDFLFEEMDLRFKGKEDTALHREFASRRCSLKRRQEILKQVLVEEQEPLDAKFNIDRNEHAGWFTAEQAIPCVLHLIIRISEKLFWGLLGFGLDRYFVGDEDVRRAFVNAVELFMNGKCLGKRTTAHGYKKMWSNATATTTVPCSIPAKDEMLDPNQSPMHHHQME